MKLTDREWKEFKIGDLFCTKKVQGRPIENYSSGNVPYITTASTNNGLTNFISSPQTAISDKRCISIDPIKGKAFYHPYEFVGRGFSGASINLLYNENINENIAMFLCGAIEKTAKHKASYGYLFNSNRLENGKIMLPITTDGQPDYQFMEDYIKEIMHKKRQEYIEYAKVKLEQNRTEQKVPLHSKKWKEFFMIDIFSSIQRGKRLIKDKQIAGNVPYVSSTAMDNGVDNFIQYDSSKMRKYQNCLSVANSGSVGASFYEPFEYVASDHVTHLKNDNFNKNIYLFIATMTGRWSQKYNFNREINDARISREKMLLPVNNNDEPDYAYMEQYVNNALVQKYNDYLDYAKKVV